MAIHKNGLVATKQNGKWCIKFSDLNEYRGKKYNRNLRKFNGENVYNIEAGDYSVDWTSKIVTDITKYRLTVQNIYYMIRRGRIKAYRKGCAWVIPADEVQMLIDTYKEVNEEKMGFV